MKGSKIQKGALRLDAFPILVDGQERLDMLKVPHLFSAGVRRPLYQGSAVSPWQWSERSRFFFLRISEFELWASWPAADSCLSPASKCRCFAEILSMEKEVGFSMIMYFQWRVKASNLAGPFRPSGILELWHSGSLFPMPSSGVNITLWANLK